MATEDGQEPGSWVFITTSPTSIRPSKAQRSQMRQRVMREIGYSRRKVRLPSRKEQLAGSESRFKTPPKPQGSDEITYSPRSQASSASIAKSQSGDFNNYPDGSSYKTFLPPSIGALLTCPTTLENDSRSIFYHMFSDGLPSCLRIYRDKWYPICMTNAAAFDQMLATYAMHLLPWRQGQEDTLNCFILSHHNKALVSVRSCIGTSDGGWNGLEGTLAAIAALACYAHISRDMPSWKLHITAIAHILHSKRKLLHTWDPRLLALIKWVESIGSYVLDRPPSLKTSSPDVADGKFLYPSLSECAIPDIANASISRPLIGAYRALQTMNEQLSLLYSTLGEHTWQDPAEIDKLVDPVTRQLLAASCRLDPQISIGTCIRSAAMLYLAEFRRRSGISPVIVDVHVYNLRKSWEDIRCCVPMGPIFRLWLFTLGSMESTKQSDASYFLQQLRYISKEVGITSLAQYRGTLTRVLWFDPVFEQKLGIIHRNLQY